MVVSVVVGTVLDTSIALIIPSWIKIPLLGLRSSLMLSNNQPPRIINDVVLSTALGTAVTAYSEHKILVEHIVIRTKTSDGSARFIFYSLQSVNLSVQKNST